MNLLEAFITGGIGGLLGLGVGSLSAAGIVNGMNILTGYQVSYVFPAKTTAVGIIIALAFSVLAAAYPARRAATLDIAESIQYE